jgi:geranylgeranyl diphosphate synthase type I
MLPLYAGAVAADLGGLFENTTIDEICRYAVQPGGKLFRPLLLVESALAVGGRLAEVLPAAVGTEQGHVASLVHDDIIDGDLLRRGRPSVHAKFGLADAIVAGDMLIFGLFACLGQCADAGVPAPRIVAALRAVAAAGLDLCRGQSLEAELSGDPRCGIQNYLTMARLKTAALFRAACMSGAILGGGPEPWVRNAAAYGECLGVAFQIRDDLLGYTNDMMVTGKDAASDIRNKRPTLPVILAYRNGSETDRSQVEHCFSADAATGDAFAELAQVIDRTGAIDASMTYARKYAEDALNHVATLPASPNRERLEAFALACLERDR